MIDSNRGNQEYYGPCRMVLFACGGALVFLLGALGIFVGCPTVIPLTSTDADGDGVFDSQDVDDDNDGLMEIDTLEMLDNMRYNLSGSSYKISADDSGSTQGAPASGLIGYELIRNLDFAHGNSYASGTVNIDWQPAITDSNDDLIAVENPADGTNPGWPPIGNFSNSFDTLFEGNSYTIANLYVRGSSHAALFVQSESNAIIRNLGIVDSSIYGGAGNSIYVGAVVGLNAGTIIAVYATGNVDGGAGNSDNVGILVGFNANIVVASYADGSADGGVGNNDSVGALVGNNGDNGMVIASYATGSATDSGGDYDSVGALVGRNSGMVSASYATGNADGGAGANDDVGGLVGNNSGGMIRASYATGNADGGAGDLDRVGALVGDKDSDPNTGIDEVSYASGTVSGGETNHASVDNFQTLETLKAGIAQGDSAVAPFYRWTAIPDGNDADDDPDWTPATDAEKIAVYCDSDGSGTIDSSEDTVSNYAWNFGNENQIPAITCTPGGAAAQR